MTWDVTDLGFRMGLSPKVPEVLAAARRPLVDDLLARHGLHRAPTWTAGRCTPAGRASSTWCEKELGLPPTQLAASRATLAEHGNCSSPTVLLILDGCAAPAGPAGADRRCWRSAPA